MAASMAQPPAVNQCVRLELRIVATDSHGAFLANLCLYIRETEALLEYTTRIKDPILVCFAPRTSITLPLTEAMLRMMIRGLLVLISLSLARATLVVDLGYARYQGSYNSTYDQNIFRGYVGGFIHCRQTTTNNSKVSDMQLLQWASLDGKCHRLPPGAEKK